MFEHLNQAGFRVLVAEDGASAFERAKLAPPDVIILDVMLPDMDGLAVCRRLKEDQDTRDIPIIFLTALDEVVDRVRGFEMRAADYISKPFDPEEVIARVRNHLAIHNLRQSLEARNAQLEREIAQRARVEDALRESEAKYHSLFENMLNGFAYCEIILDENERPIDFVYLEVNDAFERLTGLKKDIVGKKVTQAIPGIKDTHPELFDIYGRVALTGEGTQFDIHFEPLEIWLSISVYSHQKGYFVAVFENITERKRVEETLRESEARLELAIAGSNGGEWHIEFNPDDPHTLPDEIYLSPRLKRLLGYQDDEFPNSLAAWESRIMPQDLAALRES